MPDLIAEERNPSGVVGAELRTTHNRTFRVIPLQSASNTYGWVLKFLGVRYSYECRACEPPNVQATLLSDPSTPKTQVNAQRAAHLGIAGYVGGIFQMPAPFGGRCELPGTREMSRASAVAGRAFDYGLVSARGDAQFERFMQRCLADPWTHKTNRTPSGPRT